MSLAFYQKKSLMLSYYVITYTSVEALYLADVTKLISQT